MILTYTIYEGCHQDRQLGYRHVRKLPVTWGCSKYTRVVTLKKCSHHTLDAFKLIDKCDNTKQHVFTETPLMIYFVHNKLISKISILDDNTTGWSVN